MLDLLGSDGLLAIPSAPGPAFLNEGVEPAAFQQLRTASLSLTCIAGLGGLPQVCWEGGGGRRDLGGRGKVGGKGKVGGGGAA